MSFLISSAASSDPFSGNRRLIYAPLNLTADDSDILLRVHGNPDVALRNIERELSRIAPGAVYDVHNLRDSFTNQFFPFTLISAMALFVGILALLLTASGIYGVISFIVSQRTKEIGIRIAIGASRGQVRFLVIRQILSPAVYAASLGTILALGLSSLIRSSVLVWRSFDLVGYGGAILIVLSACGAAAFYPSQRATRVDPALTLRSE